MPDQIRIDIWGHIEGESDQFGIKPPEKVDVDTPLAGDGESYERYFDECPCAFQRTKTITDGGRAYVRKEVAYDAWSARTSNSTVFYPINSSPLVVYRQEIFYEGGTQSFTGVVGSSYTSALVGGTQRYSDGAQPKYASSSYYSEAVSISSSGQITYQFENAGTYNITAFLVTPMAKPVPVPITITITSN